MWKVVRISEPPDIKVMGEVTGFGGRYAHLLGQGTELGFPVSEKDLGLVLSLIRRLPWPAQVKGFRKGRTAGEIIFDTEEGAAFIRVVEKGGELLLVFLASGTVQFKVNRAQLRAATDKE
jgi:hypothetical protein